MSKSKAKLSKAGKRTAEFRKVLKSCKSAARNAAHYVTTTKGATIDGAMDHYEFRYPGDSDIGQFFQSCVKALLDNAMLEPGEYADQADDEADGE